MPCLHLFLFILGQAESSSDDRRLENLPSAGLTDSQILHGGLILYIIGLVYIFFCIQEVTSKYLLPSVNSMIECWKLRPDAGGEVLLSLTISLPEILIVSFSTYLADNTLGIATIYGSAAMKGMLCIGICSLGSSAGGELQWWVVVRDSLLNVVALAIVIILSWPSLVAWWEGLILLGFYGMYAVASYYNKWIERTIKKYLRIPYEGDEIDFHLLPDRVFPIRRYSITDLKDFIPPKLNFKKGVLAKMIRNAEFEVVRSRSDRLMELRARLKRIFYIILAAIEEKKRCCKQNKLERKVIKKFEGEENSNSNPIQEEIISRIRRLESIQSEEPINQQTVVKVVPRGSRLKHYFLLPLSFMLKLSIPNAGKYKKLSPVSVVASFVWLGFLCFLMVWWMTDVGRGLTVPNGLLGVIFVAAGLNVPKIIQLLSKSLQGEEELMLSHSLKPNNVNFTLALGLAWFFYGVVTGKDLKIDSAMVNTSFVLIGALGCSYVFIGGFKWKLSKSLGVVLLFYYFLFLLFFLLLEFKQL